MILAGLLDRHLTRRANDARPLSVLRPVVACFLLSSLVGAASSVSLQRVMPPRQNGGVTVLEENDYVKGNTGSSDDPDPQFG